MHNRKLGRTADHRKALLRNLATDMIVYEKIETTEKKALELRTVVDELVTLAKRRLTRTQTGSVICSRCKGWQD